VVIVGNLGRETRKLDITTLMPGNQSITGVFLGAEIATERVQTMITGLFEEIAAGKLSVVLDRQFPLANAADAHAYIESRRAVGRVLLIP
jgi:NADPH2:quinone reductase